MRFNLLIRSSVRFRLILASCVVCCMLATIPRGWAADATGNDTVFTIGVLSAPPFAFRDSQGNWQGIAIDLWRHVAYDLALRYELKELPISGLLAALQQGQVLSVITATASAERELVVDFSHPFYSSGLAIAVPAKPGHGNWLDPLADVFSEGTAKITGVLVCLLLVAGVLVWLCERQVNPEHFRPRPFQGVGDGIWWAAVTLTTVGYGDKAPRTRLGRLVGVIWMFAAVILIALFTAQVTSSLTVTNLAGRVRGPSDLVRMNVGAIADSPAQSILRSEFGISAHGYPGFGEGLAALARGDIDAFVGPEPVVRYEVAAAYAKSLTIVGAPSLRVDYVFAFPIGSPFRKQINHSILSYIDTDEWREVLHQYLGSD